MNKNEAKLKEGSFVSLLISLCIPTIIIMIVMVVYNMADIYFIGQLGDPAMIAAVSLCGPLMSILTGIGTLFGSGGCTAISLALGRGDRETPGKITALCFWGSLFLGAAFAAAVLVFLEPVCILIGSDSTTLGYTKEYLRVITLFAPCMIFSSVFMNLMRADGSAKQSMIANLSGTVLNVVLDPVFILVFRWGVTGAAAATVLGNLCGGAYILLYARKNPGMYSFKPSDVSFAGRIVLPVFTLGLPMAFSTILMSFAHMIANTRMMKYGASALAAQGVAGRVTMLSSMIAMGICMGMQPAISFNYAAGDRIRTRRIVRNTGLIAFAAAIVLSLSCYFFRVPILTAFIDNDEVRTVGEIVLTASVLGCPFFALYQLCATWLQSTGRAGYATAASLLNKGVIYLAVLFVLEHFFGMYGIVFTAAVTDTLSLLAALILCRAASRRVCPAAV